MSATPTRPLRRLIAAGLGVATDPMAYLRDGGRHPTDHPTVGMVGFYGWGNYGDELFEVAFRQHLGSAVDLERVLVPGERLAGRGIRRRILEADAVLLGGGDIVVPWQETRYWKPIFLRRPVFLAGVGVPTYRDPAPEAMAALRRFLRDPNVRSIGTRDAESGAWIRERIAPVAEVTVAPDLVCAVELPPASPPKGERILGIAVRRREQPDDLSHVRALAQRAVELGYRIRRIVLATGSTRRNDLEAIAGLGLEGTELVSTDDLDAISRAIGECSVLASMKFHGLVVATMYGVPTLAMMPTTKTKNFLRDLGRPDLLTSFSAPDLPSKLQREMARIDPEAIGRLRGGARASLAHLRESILEATRHGSGRGANQAG